jgi:hypothetical protein
MCEYNQTQCANPFELGEVVIHKETKEIGVVIQIHDEQELRVDMFGNACCDEIRLATVEDLLQWENEVMRKQIVYSLDLFQVPELLPKKVQKIITKFGECDTYDKCEAMLNELEDFGFTFEYYLDAVPYGLHKIGTEHFDFHTKNIC